MSYGDNYGNKLSNSMVQKAQFCTLSYLMAYGKQLNHEVVNDAGETTLIKAPRRKVYDATTLGVLAHSALENILEGREKVISTYLTECGKLFGLETETVSNLVNRYTCAVDAVQTYGKRYGKTYSAPEMTSHWKNNFTHVDVEFARVQENIGGGGGGGVDTLWKLGLGEILGGGYLCVLTELGNRCWSPDDWEEVLLEHIIAGDVFGIEMIGTLDVLLINHVSKKIQLIDYKTGRKRWALSDVLNSDQFCLYAHMLHQEYPDYSISVGVRDLKSDEYVSGSVNTSGPEMGAWAVRYRPKARLARFLLDKEGDIEPSIIPAGSGFSPGCPCEFSPHCPYVF